MSSRQPERSASQRLWRAPAALVVLLSVLLPALGPDAGARPSTFRIQEQDGEAEPAPICRPADESPDPADESADAPDAAETADGETVGEGEQAEELPVCPEPVGFDQSGDEEFDETGDADQEEVDENEPLPGFTGGGPVIGDNPIRALDEANTVFEQPVSVIGSAAAAAAARAVAEAERLVAGYVEDQQVAEAVERGRLTDLDRHDSHIEATRLAEREMAEQLDDLENLLRRVAVALYLGQDDVVPDLVEELDASGVNDGAIALVDTRSVLERRRSEAVAAEEQLGELVDRTDRLWEERLGLVADVREATDEVERIGALIDAAEAELAVLRGQVDQLSAQSTGPRTGLEGMLASSSLTFPVAGPWNFIDSWGFPRSGGRRHLGADIFSPMGTPLVAIEDGWIRSGTNNLGGLVVYLDGVSGNTYYYAHLSALHPRSVEGGVVRAGDVVGFIGTSGNAAGTPPHLHFGLRLPGTEPVNPYPLLRALAEAVDASRALGATATVPSDRLLTLGPDDLRRLIVEEALELAPSIVAELPPETLEPLVAEGLIMAPVPEPGAEADTGGGEAAPDAEGDREPEPDAPG